MAERTPTQPKNPRPDTPLDLVAASRWTGLCPKKPYLLRCTQQPSLRFPARCDSWQCQVCAPTKLARLAGVLAFAARQHRSLDFWTLTAAPEEWQTRRQKVRDLRRCLAKRNLHTEFTWATEVGAAGMTHVHALVHGDRVPPDVLGKVWGQHTESRPARSSEARNLTGYILKSGFTNLSTHLHLNGGKGASWTSGYLGADLRTTQAALRAQLGKDALDWHLEPVR